MLGYLSGTKMLGLENIVSGHDTAQNLSKYASYLDRRIRTYGAIKYDIIRDKSERRGTFSPVVFKRRECFASEGPYF